MRFRRKSIQSNQTVCYYDSLNNHFYFPHSPPQTTEGRKKFIKTAEQLMKKLISFVTVDEAGDEVSHCWALIPDAFFSVSYFVFGIELLPEIVWHPENI